MRVRHVVASAVVAGLAPIAFGAAPAAAQYPQPESAGGYAPRPARVCDWACLRNRYPGNYDFLVRALDRLGTKAPTPAVYHQETRLIAAQVEAAGQVIRTMAQAINDASRTQP